MIKTECVKLALGSKYALLMLFCALSFPKTLLSQNDDIYNYRDQCRSIIAGQYWKVVDNLNSQSGLLKVAQDKKVKLNREIKVVNSEISKLEKDQKKNIYNRDRDQKLHVAKARLTALKKYAESQDRQMPKLRDKIEKLSLEREEWRKKMEPIFKLVEKSSSTRGTIPKSITYKRSCPKFRHVCPLKKEEKTALQKMYQGAVLPTPCLKYTYIR